MDTLNISKTLQHMLSLSPGPWEILAKLNSGALVVGALPNNNPDLEEQNRLEMLEQSHRTMEGM